MKEKGFQTEYEVTGEYEMLFLIDLPKILKAFIEDFQYETKLFSEAEKNQFFKDLAEQSKKTDKAFKDLKKFHKDVRKKLIY